MFGSCKPEGVIVTNRERELASLGLDSCEGIELARRVILPSGREARRLSDGSWEVQPWGFDHWAECDDVVAALRLGIKPNTRVLRA
jgi:hypothetical protein